MLTAVTLYLRTLTGRIGTDEKGFSTAELLGNAALGIAALVIIWAALQGVGTNVISWIQAQLLG
jgi:hypothetical protein